MPIFNRKSFNSERNHLTVNSLFLECQCYTNHPETIETLNHEIEVAIRGVKAQTIENNNNKTIHLKEYP